MVERTLHEQSPDEEFTKNTLERIFEEASKANDQWNKSIFMEQCKKVSEMIDKLSDSDEKQEAEIRLLKMQAAAAASWLGEPEHAYEKYEQAYNLIKDRQQKDKTEQAKVLESLTQACANNYDYDKMRETATRMASAYKAIGDTLRSSLGLAFADVADIPSDADKSQNRFMASAFSLKKEGAGFSWQDVAAYRCRDFGKSGMDENQLIADIRNEMLALRKEAVDKYTEAYESWLKAEQNIDKEEALEEAISSAQHAAALYQEMDMVEDVLRCENYVDRAKEKLRDLEAGVTASYLHGHAKRGRDAQTIFSEGSGRQSPLLAEYSAAIADWYAFALDDIPLHPEVGKRWNDHVWGDSSVRGESAVESISETVTTPAGPFKECMKVVSNFVANAEVEVDAGDKVRKACYPGERICWFAKGVGLVKLKYIHENGSITNLRLVEYSAKLRKDDYYPLDEGNWWRHEWENDKGEFRFHQFSRVVLKQQKEEKEIFNISFVSHLMHK